MGSAQPTPGQHANRPAGSPAAWHSADRSDWQRAWAQLLAVCRFEVALQAREPATYLYPLVFLLLSFAFASSSTVDLVRDDGTLPTFSSLSLTLAMGGLSAFGQVITTMITASAFLRDRAVRADGLLFATPVSLPYWVLGRLVAVWIVVALVYSAMPVGLLLGASMPWVSRALSIGEIAWRAAQGWLAISLPSSIAVATVLAAVALRTQRLMAVLAGALTLLFLWQGCESVIARAAPDVVAAQIAALVDPFGTTAVQVATGDWAAEERASRAVPLAGLVLASRLLWLALAGVAAWVACGTSRGVLSGNARNTLPTEGAVLPVDPRAAARRAALHATYRATRLPQRTDQDSAGSNRAATTWWTQLITTAAFTARWLWRDRGWQVVAALGMLNVLVQSFTGDAPDGAAVDIVLRVQEHARLFLILLATVYAGELLWRDVDDRTEQLVHSASVTSSALVGGRVLGVVASQGALIVGLLVAAFAGAALRHGSSASPLATMGIGLLWLWVPFVQWMVLSLAVHVLLRDKVIAHLCIIAGWVLAFTLNANTVLPSWVRIADPPGLAGGAPPAVTEAMWRALGWSVVCAAALAFVVSRWRRVARAS